MTRKKLLVRILEPVIHRFGNQLAYLIAILRSTKTIGSPIYFEEKNGLRLQEVDLLSCDEPLRNEFLDFCYPREMENREKEIEYDKKYWPRTSTFLAFDSNNRIAGCAQFVTKYIGRPLPAEHATVENTEPATALEDADGISRGRKFEIHRSLDTEPCAEIYRLRVGEYRLKPLIVLMLFKAVWAKVVQTSTMWLYLTCSSDHRIMNLYQNYLCFLDLATVSYEGNRHTWRLLRMNCMYLEHHLAQLSMKQFEFVSYVRSSLNPMTLRIGNPEGAFNQRKVMALGMT